jgi:polysaccharide pyruvyl transferase WcaK-like protein
MKIHILCGNAAFNRGDRGNLFAQLSLLKERFPDADISYDSFRIDSDRAWYPARGVRRGWLLSWPQIKEISSSDIVVWGGGALVADNSFKLIVPMWLTIIAIVKLLFRKPIMVWAQGVVLNTWHGRLLARLTFSLVDQITIRDLNSVEALVLAGVKRERILKTADPAMLIPACSEEVGRKILADLGISKKVTILAPSFWPFHHHPSDILPFMLRARIFEQKRQPDEERYCNTLAEIISKLNERYDSEVLLVPHYPTLPWRDLSNLELIRSRCAKPERVHILARDDYSPDAFVSIYRLAEVVLAGTLHDAIFAASLNVPMMQIAYEQKCRDIAEAVGGVAWCVNLEDLIERNGAEKVLAIVDELRRDWDSHKAERSDYVMAYKKVAYENVVALEKLAVDAKIA